MIFDGKINGICLWCVWVSEIKKRKKVKGKKSVSSLRRQVNGETPYSTNLCVFTAQID